MERMDKSNAMMIRQSRYTRETSKKMVKTFLCAKLKYEFYDNVMNEGFRFLNSTFLSCILGFIRFNIKPLYFLCRMMMNDDVVEL